MEVPTAMPNFTSLFDRFSGRPCRRREIAKIEQDSNAGNSRVAVNIKCRRC